MVACTSCGSQTALGNDLDSLLKHKTSASDYFFVYDVQGSGAVGYCLHSSDLNP